MRGRGHKTPLPVCAMPVIAPRIIVCFYQECSVRGAEQSMCGWLGVVSLFSARPTLNGLTACAVRRRHPSPLRPVRLHGMGAPRAAGGHSLPG